ncbi:MAG: chromosomal replication initiator protein DnaA [Ruminococcus sp.]|nr:chromosomal replication initiator protein DnaA [Ruminococcus sp.]
MDSFNEAWVIITDYCKENMSKVAYDTWIKRIEPIDLNFEKNQTVLLVPNDFHKRTLMKCYIPHLNEAFNAVFGQHFDIIFKVPEEVNNIQEKEQKDTAETGYEFTFDTFIVGSSNKFAHAASIAVAQNPAGAYNPLFLYGNSGLGKTHLLYAISNEVKKNNPKTNIVYVKGDDFTNELVESIRKNTTTEVRNKYRNADVLLMDDVQFIGGKERTQEEFFHTFNALYEANKQIVLTSDRPPREIRTLEDRLRSRFESGLLADIQPPDIETRIAIIKRKSEILGINLNDDVCEYIAKNLKSNIRQLEGVVKKLKAKVLLSGEEPSLAVVKEGISDILNNDTPPELTVEKIIEEVGRTYGFSPEELRSTKNRRANINRARHIAIYIVRNLTNLSMVDIGKEFGNRHYSTIVYNVQQITEKMESDSKLKESVEDIIKNIRDR